MLLRRSERSQNKDTKNDESTMSLCLEYLFRETGVEVHLCFYRIAGNFHGYFMNFVVRGHS